MEIKFISYTGQYPNLCRGILTLELDGIEMTFGDLYGNPKTDYDRFWSSGGGCIEDVDGGYHVELGKWRLVKERLAKELVPYGDLLIKVFNENVEYGCCGGCV